MTNIEAYMINGVNEGDGILTLERYSIDVTLDDNLQVSNALGMIAKAMAADYKQGNTQETLSYSSRRYLINSAKAILEENGVELIGETDTVINGGRFL